MNTNPIRVLLIEDDEVDREIVMRALSRAQSAFEIATASSIKDGLNTLYTAEFDIVISDLSLPDGVGIETVNVLSEHCGGTPLMILTGSDCTETEVAALETGAQEYIPKKSISDVSLERSILHAIQRHQYQSRIQVLLREVGQKNLALETQKNELLEKNRRLHDLYQAAHSFVDNASHEFRMPLSTVNDYVSLVRDGMAGQVNEEQRQLLDVVSVQVDDLNNMVDDLIDVSRLESGMLKTWRRECCLSDIAMQIVPALQRKAAAKEIVFVVEIPEELTNVFCDAEKVTRVIANLVNNAMKVADSYSTVRLWADEDGSGKVIVGVDMNGAGIAPTELNAINQRLKEPKIDLRSSTRNFGLGLNIAKEMIDLNLGKMAVHSELGVGSVFSFSLPSYDSVHVVALYLEYLNSQGDEQQKLCAYRCTADRLATQSDLLQLESLLQSVIDSKDLLIGDSSGSWTVFIAKNGDEGTDSFAESLQSERQRSVGRRLSGELPKLSVEKLGEHNVASDSERVINLVRKLRSETVAMTEIDSHAHHESIV